MTLTDFDEVVTADFLTLHVPLDEVHPAHGRRRGAGPDAAGLAAGQRRARRRGGRGGAVRGADAGRHVAGAALDVHETEGEGTVSRFAELANVVLTPHIGAMAVDSQRLIGERVVELVQAYRRRTSRRGGAVMANMSFEARGDEPRRPEAAGAAGRARGRTPVVAVGAHDAMSARLIDSYGFDAVWVSGFGVSAMAYGLPDLNLVTMTETLDVTRRIEGVTELPVVVDCDNGYGGLQQRGAHAGRVRPGRRGRRLHRGQPVPEAEQPLPGAVPARAGQDLGAGPPAPGREGGPGVGGLRGDRPGGGADRRPRRGGGDASGPPRTPTRVRTRS